MQYEIIKNENEYIINGVSITDEKMTEIGYVIIRREEMIDVILDVVNSSVIKQREQQKKDLKYLFTLKDVFIYSSLSRSKYIAYSDNSDEFKRISNEMITETMETIVLFKGYAHYYIGKELFACLVYKDKRLDYDTEMLVSDFAEPWEDSEMQQIINKLKAQ